MAAAGVSYFVGRESNSSMEKRLSGVQKQNARSHQFKGNGRPFCHRRRSKQRFVGEDKRFRPGRRGKWDSKMQAYNFRLCLTQVDENKVPFPKPIGMIQLITSCSYGLF